MSKKSDKSPELINGSKRLKTDGHGEDKKCNRTLYQLSQLKVFNESQKRHRNTHIICTIGPATKDVPHLVDLMRSGMDIVRLNFSHGTHDYHKETINNIREATKLFSKEIGFEVSVAIALDIRGPKIRTGLLEGDNNKDRTIIKGSEVTVTIDDSFKEKCNEKIIFIDYKNLIKVVKPGHVIYIDDGSIALKVIKSTDKDMVCQAENTGSLGSQKGVNLPHSKTDLPVMSDKDKSDLKFGVEQNVDIIFASFIRNKEAVEEIRSLLGSNGKQIKIVSKIENTEGIESIDGIIDASDGIMVARGDMGIEIPPEKVFIAQKAMIAKCNLMGKPVICATHMLESMTFKPRATRAESADVANAVIDGADCVMLSGESAKGSYPIESVQHMDSVCKEAEGTIEYYCLFRSLMDTVTSVEGMDKMALAMIAVQSSILSRASAIIVSDKSGSIASDISRFRPSCPIIAGRLDAQSCRQLKLFRGIIPVVYDGDVKSFQSMAIKLGTKIGFIKKDDMVIVVDQFKDRGGNITLLPVASQ